MLNLPWTIHIQYIYSYVHYETMGNRYALEVCHSINRLQLGHFRLLYYWNLSLIVPITGTTLPLCMEIEITTYPDMYAPSHAPRWPSERASAVTRSYGRAKEASEVCRA